MAQKYQPGGQSSPSLGSARLWAGYMPRCQLHDDPPLHIDTQADDKKKELSKSVSSPILLAAGCWCWPFLHRLILMSRGRRSIIAARAHAAMKRERKRKKYWQHQQCGRNNSDNNKKRNTFHNAQEKIGRRYLLHYSQSVRVGCHITNGRPFSLFHQQPRKKGEESSRL